MNFDTKASFGPKTNASEIGLNWSIISPSPQYKCPIGILFYLYMYFNNMGCINILDTNLANSIPISPLFYPSRHTNVLPDKSFKLINTVNIPVF